MLVKRYHVKDMQQAMDTIIKELGPDAVILSSQKVKQKGLFAKPLLEVMVAYDPAKVPLGTRMPPERKTGASASSYGGYAGSGGASPPLYNPPGQPVAPAYAARRQETAYVPQGQPSVMPAAQAVRAYGGQLYQNGGEPAAGPPREDFKPLDPARPADMFRAPAAAAGPYADAPAEDGHPGGERMNELDSRINELDNVLNDFINRFSYVKRDITYDYPEDVVALLCRLVENQVREELAHSLARETDTILKKQPGADAREVMEHLILEQLGASQPIMPKKYDQKVVMLLGPTGVGKTTSLVKLAAKFSVGKNKKVGVINTDTYRIAAQEQIKTYTDILGIPMQVVYNPEELTDAMRDMSDRDLIFIDTAGKRPGDPQHREDIQRVIELTQPDEILLCISASTGFSAVQEIIDTYQFVDRYKLMVTKQDETKYRGMILNLLWYTHKPLAYVTTGQNVPDDIENADMESIASSLLS